MWGNSTIFGGPENETIPLERLKPHSIGRKEQHIYRTISRRENQSPPPFYITKICIVRMASPDRQPKIRKWNDQCGELQSVLGQLLTRSQSSQPFLDSGIRPVILFELVDILRRSLVLHLPPVALNLTGSRPTHAIELFKEGRDIVPACSFGKKDSKPFSILDSLCPSLALVWCHSVGGIAYEHSSTANVGRQWILIAQLPKSDIPREFTQLNI
jgi:hypothetical protein